MLENTYRKQVDIEEQYHFDKICESLIKTNDHADQADVVTRELVEKYQSSEDKIVEWIYEVLRKNVYVKIVDRYPKCQWRQNLARQLIFVLHK